MAVRAVYILDEFSFYAALLLFKVKSWLIERLDSVMKYNMYFNKVVFKKIYKLKNSICC